MESECEKDPLPHHEQQPLCTSRLPYRQGRKLTAIKVYTINDESNHLLVFGVPSINIRQETKNLFMKFGKLLKFTITKEHKSEKFTETYHAMYENIRSARIAKKYIDTKNFYGGILHVCYAPELETVEETKKKLLLRKKDVLSRLKNLESEKNAKNCKDITNPTVENRKDTAIPNINENKTLNMGYENIIYINSRKRKLNEHKIKKNELNSNTKCYNQNELKNKDNEFSTFYNKPSTSHNDPSTALVKNSTKYNESGNNSECNSSKLVAGPIYYNNSNESGSNHNEFSTNHNHYSTKTDNVEIIDFSSTDRETISNINEALNYNKFGNEVIRKIENKTLNRIKFHFNK